MLKMKQKTAKFPRGTKPFIRQATEADCHDLAPRLRLADLQEVRNGSGSSGLDALLLGFRNSRDCHAVIANGRVAMIFGASDYQDGQGIVWAMGSPEIEAIAKFFHSEAAKWIASLSERYRAVISAVWEGNTKHIRWLRRLGFKFAPAMPIGNNSDAKFFPIYKELTRHV
jgi:hypothetical protein